MRAICETLHCHEKYLDVLGIPVILYLALMSGVEIDENPTKPELYYHKVIFSTETSLNNAKIKGAIFYAEQLDILKQICDLSTSNIYVRTANRIELLSIG